MIDFIKRLFGFSATPVEAPPANTTAPYKVPEPAATTPIPLIPVGTEATMATPATVKPKAPARTAKPKAPAKAKAPAKPRATKAKPQA